MSIDPVSDLKSKSELAPNPLESRLPTTNEPQEYGTAVIDQTHLTSLRGIKTPGEADFVGELIDLFLGEAAANIAALRAAQATADEGEVRRILHRLKGSCGNIGAVRMATFLAGVERTDKALRSENFVSQIETEFRLVQKALAKEREAQGP